MKFKKIVITGLTEKEISNSLWERLNNLTDTKIFLDANSPELAKELAVADCLFTKFNPVTAEMFEIAKELKYIGVFATGYGKIDKEKAIQKGVTVTNIPGYSTESVAEFVIAVLLEKLRDLERAKKQTREKVYSESGFSASEIKNKYFGVIGLGRIGTRVAELAHGFSANVKYWSKSEKNVENKFEHLNFDDLLSTCDIISIHIALNEETKEIISKEAISKIKSGAIIINTSPMELVNLDALIQRLKRNDITFILDHSDEMDQEVLNELHKYENCIIYPPIAYISKEAGMAKQEIFVDNVENFLNGFPTNMVI